MRGTRPWGRPMVKSARELLASASHEALRRASPAECVRMGYSPLARRYVLETTKATSRTPSISARAAETLRTRERYGLQSPEIATEARKQGALEYQSAEQRERVAKAAGTRLDKREMSVIEKLRAEGERIKSANPHRPSGRGFHVKPGDAERYSAIVRRKMAGEWIPDGDWHWAVDIAKAIDVFGEYSAVYQRVYRRGYFGAPPLYPP
jgi:hypothetical protein